MFESLSTRLQDVFKSLRGETKLTPEAVEAALREIRMALLEADVNFKVARDFIERVRNKSLGQEVIQSIQPGQQIIKIIHDELVDLLGSSNASLQLSGNPSCVLMVGLHGSGKTTSSGKLGRLLLKQGRTPLLIATSQQDWKTARRLVDAGAAVDLADKDGFTPVMAAAMHGDPEMFGLLLARSTNLRPEKPCTDGQDLLSFALDGGDPEIIETVEQRLPIMSEWTTSTRRALSRALQASKNDKIRLLLSKHSAPPTPEGKSVPFLAYAIASSNVSLFNTLLNCGADPNTLLPSHCDKDFLALLPNGLRSYIQEDRNVTMLMLAAGLGQVDYLRTLIDGGANRTRLTTRNKMSALDVAAETGHWRSAQILLGGGPAPENLRIEISLPMQSVALVRDGVPIYHARCSTGRAGHLTKRGEFVITNKERNHRSTIYHVEMPYFMRLSCLDFGMHAGYVPNHPASHGCIRLPEDTARKFFSEIPVGTLVTVQ